MPYFGTTKTVFGAYTVRRDVWRDKERHADARWLFYVAGVVNPGDGNNATISLEYLDDTNVLRTIGTIVETGSGFRKFANTVPFDLFATAGVPPGENVVAVLVGAQKNAGVSGQIYGVGVWCEHVPKKR